MLEKVINLEKLIITYLSEMLESGITSGVTEEDFFCFVEKLENEFNYTIIEKCSFENIICKANEFYFKSEAGILMVSEAEKNIAKPTYHLKKVDKVNELWPRHYTVLKNVIAEKTEIIQYNFDMIERFPGKIISVANKVAAVYVNDAINRYVKSKIDDGRWPRQCSDIDEYIFKRDIARYIDEEGTRKTLHEAYIHAIAAVCNIMHLKSGEGVIEFSNDKRNLLAYANFKQLYLPEQFGFLGRFVYSEYEIKNKQINLAINVETVSFSTLSCTYSDPYGEWSDEFEHKSGLVDDRAVEIMKKRLFLL